MTEHLYRIVLRKATVLCAILALASGTHAQSNRYQPPAGPRAVGIIQVAPNGTARLVPIVYYENGKFYDARLYRANPVPIVLEPETVYEGQQNGVADGLFTVNSATQLNGNWYGVGKWSSYADQPKKVEKIKDSITAPTSGEDRDRPILRRPGSKKDAPPKADAPQPTDSSKKDDKAPPPETEKDPDRPRLKRPATQTETAQATPPETATTPKPESQATGDREPPDDPDRPRLRRGKPVQTQPDAFFPGMEPDPAKTSPRVNNASRSDAMKPVTPIQFKTYMAVSDTKPSDPRPYEFEWSAEERSRQTQAIAKLAAAEVAKFAAARKIKLPKQLDGKTDVRAFDVDYSNTPEVVFTGVYPLALDETGRPNEIYVTYVARIGYEDKPEKIFSTVTDSQHLDAWPRLELIDAVDVEGDGRGDLLFREYTGDGKRYAIFRASAYELRRLFAGGSGE